MIPYGRQDISDDDIDTVISVLKSDYLTQGPFVERFESEISIYCSSNFCTAFNSATSALHAACSALEASADDIIWTSAITFVASANCALYCGASIDFVDISNKTYNICTHKLEAKLKEAFLQNKLPKIIIPVHLAGQSCDMKRIHELSLEYGFKIIEDASHAIGGSYLDSKIGQCKYSDITIFSFHPVKIITSGEGGVATTNDKSLQDKMLEFRTHGITKDANKFSIQSPGPWYYEQNTLGYNYRITDFQAALGCSQLKRLDEFIEKRHILANRYNDFLSNSKIVTPFQEDFSYSSFHLYIIWINFEELKITQSDAFNFMRQKSIGVNLHYIPVYKHPFYQKLEFTYNYCHEAEIYYSGAMSIPIFPSLSIDDQDIVIDSLKELTA